MQPTADIHAQTVAMISDAVTDITRRAVAPALDPFHQRLSGVVGRIDGKLDEVDEVLMGVHADRTALRAEINALNGRIAELHAAHAGSARQVERLRGLMIAILVGTVLIVLALGVGAVVLLGR